MAVPPVGIVYAAGLWISIRPETQAESKVAESSRFRFPHGWHPQIRSLSTLRFRSLHQAYTGSHTLICPKPRLFQVK